MKILLGLLILIASEVLFFLLVKNRDTMRDDWIDPKDKYKDEK